MFKNTIANALTCLLSNALQFVVTTNINEFYVTVLKRNVLILE